MGGRLDDYPDYAGSEDEYDAEAIEAELERSPYVIRPEQVAPPPHEVTAKE